MDTLSAPGGPAAGGARPPVSCTALLEAPNEVPAPDFGLFRDVLNSHFYPADISDLEPSSVMRDPRISAVHLPRTTIGYVRFGTAVSVDPGDLAAYHVNVVLSGSVASQCGEQTAIATPQVAAVFSPSQHTILPRWDAAATQLSIKFTREVVEQELSHLLGRPVDHRIDFRLALPVDSGPGRHWLALLSALLQCLDAPRTEPLARHMESLERSLISGLLVSQTHSYTDALSADPVRHTPRGALARVIDEIERAPDRAYELADLAKLAGISARSLQYSFLEQYGTSPMRYLRRIRLQRAHEDLCQLNGSVADIAYYWGFTNLGRFAQAYREQFGELPAATLASVRQAPASRRR
jgi:AraC-like DNA-binding protein